MKYVISVGGGIGSTVLLPIVALWKYGKEAVDLFTCLLPNEHPDLYRLEADMEKVLGVRINRIGLGKSPMEIFHEVGFLGNSRIDPCSDRLKRAVAREYILSQYKPEETTILIGINADEIDRTLRIRKAWRENGYRVEFPLLDYNYTSEQAQEVCFSVVGYIPELYTQGFKHNNCAGACVKAGKREWARLLFFHPEVYQEWEEGEKEFQQRTGTTYTILRETRRGKKVGITLETLRQRLEPHFANKERTVVAFEQILTRGRVARWLPDDNQTGCKFCDALA